MKNSPNITVLATFSTDRLINQDGTVINEQPGGPALFISSVLKSEGVEFESINPEQAIVEILITDEGEFGKIPNPPKPLTVNFSIIEATAIIISTLLDEIDLKDISSYKGQVFLDAQGYVRDGSNFGKPKKWRPDNEILQSVTCLKATDNELKNINTEFVNILKSKMLLVTHGALGSTLYCEGKEYTVNPKKVVSVDNTIGAGDTLFAYFVTQIVAGKKPIDSLKFATKKTSTFLNHIH